MVIKSLSYVFIFFNKTVNSKIHHVQIHQGTKDNASNNFIFILNVGDFLYLLNILILINLRCIILLKRNQ